VTNQYDVDVTITGELAPGFDQILSPEAVAFVAELHRRFGARRDELLALRVQRQADIDAGIGLDFLTETAHVRDGDWRVAPPAPGLVDRRVEITGPTDRKMTINALNSGAKVWLADFEDAITPTWDNVVSGQINLRDALDRTIDFSTPDGKSYALGTELATLVVRPRGWHLVEKHLLVDGQPVAGALLVLGLYFLI
jgi:malate synthase